MNRIIEAAGIVAASVVMSLAIYPMVQANSDPPCNTDTEQAHEVITDTGTYLDCDWRTA